MREEPLVSVVTPVYNGEALFGRVYLKVCWDKRIRTISTSSSTTAAKIVRWISLWPAQKGFSVQVAT